MKVPHLFACAMIFSLSAAPFAWAETATPPAPAASDAASKPAPMSADAKKARSKECSDEADAKGLKGKERKKFREHCKHAK